MSLQAFYLYALLCISTLIATATAASEPRLFIDWPPDWELRQSAQSDQRTLHMQGRHRHGKQVAQELTMTLIDIGSAGKPVTHASIKDLAQRLRARFHNTAGIGELEPFANDRGYYFVVTDRREESPKYVHLVEGVMLDSGYMIEFVLETNDARAAATLTMLTALENFEIR